MYLQSNGSIPVAITDGNTKYNYAGYAHRRRRTTNVLHLSSVKPQLVTKQASFKAIYGGQQLLAGEFRFATADGLAFIENINDITGAVSVSEPETYAIPINEITDTGIVVSDIHYETGIQ